MKEHSYKLITDYDDNLAYIEQTSVFHQEGLVSSRYYRLMVDPKR